VDGLLRDPFRLAGRPGVGWRDRIREGRAPHAGLEIKGGLHGGRITVSGADVWFGLRFTWAALRPATKKNEREKRAVPAKIPGLERGLKDLTFLFFWSQVWKTASRIAGVHQLKRAVPKAGWRRTGSRQ